MSDGRKESITRCNRGERRDTERDGETMSLNSIRRATGIVFGEQQGNKRNEIIWITEAAKAF